MNRYALLAALAAPLSCALPAATPAHDTPEDRLPHRILAVFAHPDDERHAGPLLARYAREGVVIDLVIATDGSKGVREHAGIPAGPELARARAAEARCAAEQLGIRPPHLLGLEDAGLASFAALGRLREQLLRLQRELDPDVVITFGPEGSTGHPDHRLVSSAVTEIVQAAGGQRPRLFYVSAPAERLAAAPPSAPLPIGVPERLLTVRIAFTERDRGAAVRSFACHATQYTPDEMAALNRTLASAYQGIVYLRPAVASETNTTTLVR